MQPLGKPSAVAEKSGPPKGSLAYWPGNELENGAVVESVDENNIVAGPETGITLVDDDTLPGKKALAFDGSQTVTATSMRPIMAIDSFTFQLKAKPDNSGAQFQTLLYFFGSAELRYNTNRGNVALIVWSAPGEAKEISAKILPGEWNTIVATVHGGNFKLTVNDQTVEGTMEGQAVVPVKGKLQFGLGSQRPYKGEMAEIAVTELTD